MNDKDFIMSLLESNKTLAAENSGQGVVVSNEAIYGQNALTQEITKMKSAINANVNIPQDGITVYPDDNDVVMSGTISDLNNLQFQFKYNDSAGGCYITISSPLVLNKENYEKISKIYSYYQNWKQEWLKKLPEYQNKKQ